MLLVRTNEHKASAAARIGASRALRERAALMGLLRSCFARTQTWLQAGKYLNALVSDLPSRNGWSVAEYAGDRSPGKSQRLLNRASWDERAAMSLVRRYAAAGLDDGDPGRLLPPPPGITVADLEDATRQAAAAVAYLTPPHPVKSSGWLIAWGDELDVRVITMRGTGTVTDLMVASYLAKYSTKGTEVTGHASARITPETVELYADPAGTHIERLIHACWTLGAHLDYRSLQRWAHMFGFGGHFLTKGRHYSIRFRDLRDARIIYRITQTCGPDYEPIHCQPDLDSETTLVINQLFLCRKRLADHRRRASRQQRGRPGTPQTPGRP
jgi:hypothetical protein